MESMKTSLPLLRRLPLRGALLCLLAAAPAALAQEPADPGAEASAIPLGPQTAFVPPSTAASWGSQNQGGPAVPPLPGAPEPPPPLRWGQVVLDPRLTYGVFYSDGILASPGHPVSTVLQSLSPGLFLQLSPEWTLDYGPTWEWYSNPLFQSTFDQAARLEGKVPWQDWALDFTQTYARTSEPLVETGRQTPEQDYATELKADYGPEGSPRLELALDQDILTSPVVPDSYGWSTLDWLHFPIAPRLDTAIGAGLGYILVDPGYDMDYLRPEARVTWRAADRLSFDLQGGVEERRFIGSGGGTLETPIFNASAEFKAGDTTTLTADARRDVEVGYTVDEVERATNVSLGLQQRILRHFVLGGEVGRETVTYIGVGRSLVDVRGDRSTTFQLSLNTVLFRRLSVAVQYSNLRDDSNLAGFGFASNQYGLTVQYKY